MGRSKHINRRPAPKPPTGLRPAEAARVMADLELIEAAGLRAAVELRGFDCGDLADELCEVIERTYTVHSIAALRLQDAVLIQEAPRA